jgi:hypothetical protein
VGDGVVPWAPWVLAHGPSLVVVFFFFVLSKILLFTQKEKKPIETKPHLKL